MHAQTHNAAPVARPSANVASPRSLNLDAGTYRIAARESGRGYGRSEGYGGPRPYVASNNGRALFRIC